MTTNKDLLILTINDELLYLLEYQEENQILGQSINTILMNPMHQEIEYLSEAMLYLLKKGHQELEVLCKVKQAKGGNLIWHFDPVERKFSSITLGLDGAIESVNNAFAFGYESVDKGLKVTDLIPQFQPRNDTIEYYYCGKSQDGSFFPIEVVGHENILNISYFPFNNGIVLSTKGGDIVSFNHFFAQTLLGYKGSDLYNQPISLIIPNFQSCLDAMEWVSPTNAEEQLSVPSGKSSVYCTKKVLSTQIKHKDGTLFRIHLQCRYSDRSSDDPLLAIWIGFYKDPCHVSSPKLHGRRRSIVQPSATLSVLSNDNVKFPQSIVNSNNLKIDDFEVIQDLGEGAFSFIKLCVHKQDAEKIPVVIKYVVRDRILSWSRKRPELGPRIPVELAVLHDLAKMPHSGIPTLRAHFNDDFYYCLITEYHPAVDLFEYVEKSESRQMSDIKSIARQTFDAVNYLHENGICHRDIKDENVLIDERGHITLIDFGSAAYLDSGPFTTFYGTKLFCAPEILEGKSYEGCPQDVWQIGILIYILVFQQNPFYSVEDVLNAQMKWPFPLSDELSSILKCLLDRDESTRYTIQQALNDPWLVL